MKTSMLLPVVVAVLLLGGCGARDPVVAGKVFLIRHCDYEPMGGGLTNRGRKQAAGIAGKLKAEKIGLILHSPVKRCDETARIVWERLGKPEIRSVYWLHEHSKEASEWCSKVGGVNVLIVTHTPVIHQMTEKPSATNFGKVTRLK